MASKGPKIGVSREAGAEVQRIGNSLTSLGTGSAEQLSLGTLALQYKATATAATRDAARRVDDKPAREPNQEERLEAESVV